ncbi:MAG: class I SAM-dependent methyltransferase [Fibrobacterota bacterium]
MDKIDWEEIWRDAVCGRTDEMLENQRDDRLYWSKRAQNYSDSQTADDFIFGRSVCEALEEKLNPEDSIIDIGAGPGTITIPLAEKVRKATIVEPASGMVQVFRENAAKKRLNNYEVINCGWEEYDAEKNEDVFDLAVSSHVLWHFSDIWKEISRIEKVSKGYCCLVNGINGDTGFEKLKEKITGKINTKGYSPSLHLILYNLLFEKGRKADVKIIEYKQNIPVESWISSREMVIARYIDMTSEIKKTIREYFLSRSNDGVFPARTTAAVMTWKKPETGEMYETV